MTNLSFKEYGGGIKIIKRRGEVMHIGYLSKHIKWILPLFWHCDTQHSIISDVQKTAIDYLNLANFFVQSTNHLLIEFISKRIVYLFCNNGECILAHLQNLRFFAIV